METNQLLMFSFKLLFKSGGKCCTKVSVITSIHFFKKNFTLIINEYEYTVDRIDQTVRVDRIIRKQELQNIYG